ncbi:MAG: type II secretion system protein [Candidatus Omnitrophica bacterium]|nr:type II secretion system protein [Candidatus Omnitrophota bacterium]
MKKGLTMLELIIVIGIVGFTLVGLLISYVSSLNLSEFDRNLTVAMNIAREKMEELYNARDLDFTNLGNGLCSGQEPQGSCMVDQPSGYPKLVSFNNENIRHNYDQFNGSCTVYLKDKGTGSTVPYGQIKEARVIVSWKQRLGDVIGEDINLNGQFDTGEDKPGGRALELDSPCELISAFAKR